MCCNVHKNDFTPTPFLKILFVVAYLHCAENLILLILLNKFSKNKITYHIGSCKDTIYFGKILYLALLKVLDFCILALLGD